MDADKIIITIIVVATLGIFGFIALTSFKAPVAGNLSAETMIGQDPHYLGKNPSEAKLVLVEFSDFECPYCQTIFPVVEGLTYSYPELSVVYRHFPLNIHKFSMPSARASEAAAKQGKFWEYATQLFDNQPKFTDEELNKYAENIGINVDQFKNDYKSTEIAGKVQEDLDYANGLNLRGTPSFYVVYDGKVESVTMSTQNSLEDKIKSILGGPSTSTPPNDSATVDSGNPEASPEFIGLQVKAINLLSKKFPDKDLKPSDIIDIQKTDWPDGSLGCPVAGMNYTQAIVPGYKISVKQGEVVTQYNSNGDFSEAVTCSK